MCSVDITAQAHHRDKDFISVGHSLPAGTHCGHGRGCNSKTRARESRSMRVFFFPIGFNRTTRTKSSTTCRWSLSSSNDRLLLLRMTRMFRSCLKVAQHRNSFCYTLPRSKIDSEIIQLTIIFPPIALRRTCPRPFLVKHTVRSDTMQ